MRPDAILWQNTNELAAIDFSPRQLLYRRIAQWMARAIFMQMVLSIAIWYGLQCASVADRILGAPGSPSWNAIQQRVASVSGVFPAGWRLSDEDLRDLLDLSVAQLIAFLLTACAAIIPVRSALKRRIGGLQQLFDGIRALASGLVPKPLPTGGPGEVGYLALAFNDMITRLTASHRRLVEMNQTLERRVEERTRELREAAQKLDHMASTDALTGLANRRALAEDGEVCFASAVRQDSDLVCLVLDLDHFKRVNDSLGHKKGDELICLAASVLRRNCQADDLIVRLGGDEFLVAVSNADLPYGSQLADRLQRAFDQQLGELFGDCPLAKDLSMSIGVASRKSASAERFEDLIARADTALYRAKDLGRSRVETFVPAKAA